MKFLVTGGAGFLGRHMIDALLARKKSVRVLDNFMASSPKALEPYKGRIEFLKGDIRDKRIVRRAMNGTETVFHFAAIRSVVKTVEDPLLAHDVNATGTLILLHEALRAKVKHFIFTSTSSVYGDALSHAQKEDGELKPISPYGIAKLAAENYAKYFFSAHRLPTSMVRIFNVYGPRQNPESRYSLVIPAILDKIFKNERPVIDGSGHQSRDFIYVDDVLDALFKILGNKSAYGEVYNLGFGKTYSINTLVSELLKVSGSSLKPLHGPRRPGDPELTCADITKARKELGWRPYVSLEEGLRRTVEFTRS